MKRDEFLEIMTYRHACKRFDEEKKIAQEDLEYILECGRLSPSSFGMEQWKFLVIQNQALKEKLRPFCWDQVQITSCSDLVVILAKKDILLPPSGYPRTMLGRRGMSEEKLEGYVEKYSTFLKEQELATWSIKQCYIAAANMMNAAAVIGIDSCAIEGFEKENVEAILELDKKEFEVALVLPFGYRVKEHPSKVRLSFDEVVEYVR
jgi:nitroreductase